MQDENQVRSPQRTHQRHQPRHRIGHAVVGVGGVPLAQARAVPPLGEMPPAQVLGQIATRRQGLGQVVAHREGFVEKQGTNIGQRQHRGERQQGKQQRESSVCHLLPLPLVFGRYRFGATRSEFRIVLLTPLSRLLPSDPPQPNENNIATDTAVFTNRSIWVSPMSGWSVHHASS